MNKSIEEIRTKIGEQIDFMCDHWTTDDDKSPRRFGGWRDEVLDSIIEIFTTYGDQRAEEASNYKVSWNIETGVDGKPYQKFCILIIRCNRDGSYTILKEITNDSDSEGVFVFTPPDQTPEELSN